MKGVCTEESPAPRSTSSGISRNTSSSIESSSSGQSPTQAKPSKSRESPKAKPSKKRRKSRAKSIEDVAAQIAAEDALLVSMGMKRSRDETKLLKDLMKESDKLYKKSPKSPMHPVLVCAMCKFYLMQLYMQCIAVHYCVL